MIDSYREATIALHSDKTMTDKKTLKDQYVNFYNNVRLGKLLEDLDSMAGECLCNLLNTSQLAII
jgi:hypothetical protein